MPLMTAFDPAAWQNLFVAVAGASAALTGLLFVAVSINLAAILAGLSITSKTGGGLYWLVPGLVFGFVGAVANAWVLLVGIHR